MGISTIAGYRGAQLFEIVGLDREVVDLCFPGHAVAHRRRRLRRHPGRVQARSLVAARDPNYALPPGGLLRALPEGEYHMYNPAVVGSLQMAVRTRDVRNCTESYADAVNGRAPAALRDLLDVQSPHAPIPIDEVEPAEAILKRFDSAGMSLGALSPEAHEALATAMNRLGARSNSGEGGEDPARYGTEKMSKIKQVASGRFGVTPEYLVNAEVLQIKIAQGAKPGEGGQLPGHKVNALIARLRYARPGIGLISPPPHHDIYSIEDLAQLIYDLKEVNPQALVSVKLVAHAGVGTIAAGVAKANADLITISGHDGGTGASPITSIRYAGVPWELGLAETQQTLARNGLRERVIVQTDGGLKTGLDVIKAAMLGAESFGFGTAPMVALGCKYLRICHLNSCATGVATQNDDAAQASISSARPRRSRISSASSLKTCVRCSRSSACVVSRKSSAAPTGCGSRDGVTVKQRQARSRAAARHAGCPATPAPACVPRAPIPGSELALRIADDTKAAVESGSGGEFHYAIRNTDRAIGARLSGDVARRHGDQGMAAKPITLQAVTARRGRVSARGMPAACTSCSTAKRTTASARAWRADASSCVRRRVRRAPRHEAVDRRQHLPVRRDRRRIVRGGSRRRTLRRAQLRRARRRRRRRRSLLRIHDRRHASSCSAAAASISAPA